MKKLIYLSILAVIISMSSPLFAQNLEWQQTNGPWGAPITNIVHCGSFLFALSGERVFRSGDSGGHWVQLPITQGDTSMGNMSSVNNILFACGVNGSFRSTDFGNSWISYTGPSGLVFGKDTALLSSDDDYLWRSYDSGANWSQVAGYPPIYCMLGNCFVRLIDAVETAGSILISTDNGSSWQAFDTTSNLTNAQTIYPVGNTLLAGRSDSELYRSFDSGRTWSRILPGPKFRVFQLFEQGGTLYGGSDVEGMFRSTDTGATWTPAQEGITDGNIYVITSIAGNLIAGTSSGIFFSTNNGNIWQESDRGVIGSIYGVQADGGTLYALMSGRAFRSDNSGDSWNRIDTGIPHRSDGIQGISHISSGDGEAYIIDYDSIYRSLDSGRSWRYVSSPIRQLLPTAIGCNNQCLFTGTYGHIFRSFDHGVSWDNEFSYQGVLEDGPAECFIRDSFVVVSDLDGWHLNISTDLGTSWSRPTIEDGYDVCLMDDSDLFLATGSGILRSHNAINWDTLVRLPNNYNLDRYFLAASGPLLITASDKTGATYISWDTGKTWLSATSNHPELNFRPLAISGGFIFATGSDGGLYRSAISNLGVANNLYNTGTPISIYPNPASLSTIIIYSNSSSEKISITICDPLGRIISRPILNEIQLPGEHELIIDTRDFAPGIYLCRLSGAGIVQETKFVVER